MSRTMMATKANEPREYAMKESVLQFLACPRCGGILRFASGDGPSTDHPQGTLVCEGGCGAYPVCSGVPRLLPEHAHNAAQVEKDHQQKTGRSFGAQWNMYQYGNTTWGISVEQRLEVVLHELGWKKPDLKGKVILDAGCGNGTLSHVLAEHGATVLALDLSESVFRAAAHCVSPRLHFLQGNLFFPPFKPGIFDAIYSCGVYHHTPDTRRCFDALAPTLKSDPDARHFVWLYAKRSPLFNASVEQLMKVTCRTPSWILVPACVAMSPLVELGSRVATRCGIVEYAPRNLRDRAVQLHDLLSPRFVHYHSYQEAAQWAHDQGFAQLEETSYHTNNGQSPEVRAILDKYRSVCRPGFGMLCYARQHETAGAA